MGNKIDAKRQRILEKQGGLCFYCDLPMGMTIEMGPSIDHLVPLSRGGTNEQKNLVVSHRKCNERLLNFVSYKEVKDHFNFIKHSLVRKQMEIRNRRLSVSKELKPIKDHTPIIYDRGKH